MDAVCALQGRLAFSGAVQGMHGDAAELEDGVGALYRERTEKAEAFGDAGGVLRLGEVGAEGGVDAEEAEALVVGGVGLQVGPTV
jgi:hypothetical protein